MCVSDLFLKSRIRHARYPTAESAASGWTSAMTGKGRHPFSKLFGVFRRAARRFEPTGTAGHEGGPHVPSRLEAMPPPARIYALTQDQQMFLEDELKRRGLPHDHVGNVRFVEGCDADA